MPLDFYSHIFAGNPLDRAGERRGDTAWLAEKVADPASLAVALWNGQPLVEQGDKGPQIAYLRADMAEELSGGPERLLFLGLWKDAAVFALDLEGGTDPSQGVLQGLGDFEDLRGLAMSLPAADAGILATAKGMFEWRRKHRHCANCGEVSHVADGGWKRICPACNAEHFPRTDPVVIMLALCGERCLVGRQSRFPPGMYSALAGFVEPGESLEEACARELEEEAGLKTLSVRYHSTQPWPYPSSLMVGLIAQVEDGEATPDQTELEEVRWFTREEARSLLAGEISGAWAPPPLAIAHHLIKAWAHAES